MQSIIKSYRATFIGLIFPVSCFLLYYTFIAPLLIMLPLPLVLESIFRSLFPDQAYSRTGQEVIVSLAILFVALSAVFFIKIIRQIRNTQTYKSSPVILYMVLSVFVVHPLVFYINLSKNWNRAHDGQFFLSVGETFQISSLAFVIIGIIIDALKMYKQKPGPWHGFNDYTENTVIHRAQHA